MLKEFEKESPQGEWFIERSDGFTIGVSKQGVRIHFGRGKALPPAQRIDNKYISRQHFSVEWRQDSLFIRQVGKNPTFYSSEFLVLPSETGTPSELEFCPEDDKMSMVQKGDFVIAVKPIPRRMLGNKGSNNNGIGGGGGGGMGSMEACTLHFPEEVFLPQFTVRYVVPDAPLLPPGVQTVIPTVPRDYYSHLMENVDDDDDDDNNNNNDHKDGKQTTHGTPSYGGGGAGWHGILDAILIEQQAKSMMPSPTAEILSVNVVESVKASAAPSVSREMKKTETGAPSSTIKTDLGKQNKAGVFTPAEMPPDSGLWEWKCHANAKDEDPAAWRRYPGKVAELLEKAYRAGESVVKVPDNHMLSTTRPATASATSAGRGVDLKRCTYSVCFGETTLNGDMIQFQNGKPEKYRRVRRRGGCEVNRSKTPHVRIIPDSASSSTEEDDEDEDEDNTDEDDEYSSSSSSSEESSFKSYSSDSNARGRKRQRR